MSQSSPVRNDVPFWRVYTKSNAVHVQAAPAPSSAAASVTPAAAETAAGPSQPTADDSTMAEASGKEDEEESKGLSAQPCSQLASHETLPMAMSHQFPVHAQSPTAATAQTWRGTPGRRRSATWCSASLCRPAARAATATCAPPIDMPSMRAAAAHACMCPPCSFSQCSADCCCCCVGHSHAGLHMAGQHCFRWKLYHAVFCTQEGG